MPVAVDNTRLQSQDDEEGQFLRLVSWQGRYQYSYSDAHAQKTDTEHGKNHQGLYVTTTAGELLGSRATRNPDQLLQMLRQALVKWDERKTQLEAFEIGELKRRDPEFIWTYPEDGLVLHLGCQDLARQVDSRFDLVAVGTRWGGTVFNVRREDVAPAPMGIAITLAGRAARDRTAPHISHTRKSWQRYFAR